MELLEVQKEADSAGRKAMVFGVLALVLAGTFGFLLARFGGTTNDSQPVVVAARNIPALTSLKASDLQTVMWPRTSLPDGTVGDANLILAVAKVNVTELVRNEPVLTPRLAAADSGVAVSTIIEAERRAFVVTATESVATATILHPGAMVDVVATLTDPRNTSVVTKTILQNIKVLAVGDSVDVEARQEMRKVGEQRDDREATQRRRVVTLSVSPADVEVLSYATNQGHVDLVMRSNADTEVVPTTGISTDKLLGSIKEDGNDSKADRPASPACLGCHRRAC